MLRLDITALKTEYVLVEKLTLSMQPNVFKFAVVALSADLFP